MSSPSVVEAGRSRLPTGRPGYRVLYHFQGHRPLNGHGELHQEIVLAFLTFSAGWKRGLGFVGQIFAGFRQVFLRLYFQHNPLFLKDIATRVHHLPTDVQNVQDPARNTSRRPAACGRLLSRKRKEGGWYSRGWPRGAAGGTIAQSVEAMALPYAGCDGRHEFCPASMVPASQRRRVQSTVCP